MKKNYRIVLSISLLIIVLIGLAEFIFLKKMANNPEPTNNQRSEKELIELLSQTFSLYDDCQTGKEFKFTDGIANIDQLTDDNINHILFSYLYNNGSIIVENKTDTQRTYSFTKESFIKAAGEVFGNSFMKNFNPPSMIKIQGTDYKLENDKYTGSSFVKACLHLNTTEYYYNGYSKDEGVYRITYLLYYTNHKLEDNKINTYVFNTSGRKNPICLKDEIKNNTNKFIAYNFVFTKEENNYIFDHVELVNKA